MLQLLPRYRALHLPSGRLSSLRWMGVGWDSMWSEKSIFVQFGKQPVKFIFIDRAKAGPPLFLLANGWKTLFSKTLFSKWGFRAGITAQPLKMHRFWRSHDVLHERRGQST